MFPSAWLAPETFESTNGQHIVSFKTDVYMFGCFMLEVVTGKEPLYWVSGGGAMKAALRCRDLTKSPFGLAVEAGTLDLSCVMNSTTVCGTVDDFVGIIRECLESEPARRPDMKGVVASLQTLLRPGATGTSSLYLEGSAPPMPASAPSDRDAAAAALRASIESEVRAEMQAAAQKMATSGTVALSSSSKFRALDVGQSAPSLSGWHEVPSKLGHILSVIY